MQERLILIVDDSRADTDILMRALAYTGVAARYETFGDGQAFLDRLVLSDRPGPDLVILDLKMPVLDGLEVLRILKDRQLKRCPILVYSSESISSDIQVSEQLGADVALVKPLSYADFFIVAQVAVGLLRKQGRSSQP